MKVIVFHSYKGGVGRTLALANLGCALSRIGKNVLVLDWDFDAPGLAIKHKVEAKVKNGYVDYLVKIRETYGYNIKFADYNVRKKFLKGCIIPTENEENLFLLPAGDRANKNYWKNIATPSFQSFFDYSDKEQYIQSCAFFKKDKELLRECLGDKGEVDYLLIDSKTGNEKAIIPLMIFADHIVELFNCNDEGVFGELHIRSAVEKLRVKYRDSDIKLTSVMTRVPTGFGPRRAMEEYQTLSAPIRNFIKIQKNQLASELLVIHELRQLEIAEEIMLEEINTEEREQNLLLTHDYLLLFNHIFKDDPGITKRIQSLGHGNWKSALGLAEDVRMMDRFFSLHCHHGYLINDDKNRNVALNCNTLNVMLDSLSIDQKNNLLEAGIEEHRVNSIIQNVFQKAGFLAGTGFGLEAMTAEDVWKNDLPESLEDRLTEWLDFDFEAGFGKWTFNLEESRKEIVIFLDGNFLKDTEFGSHFIAGYIKGVVSNLIPNGNNPVEVSITKADEDQVALSYQ